MVLGDAITKVLVTRVFGEDSPTEIREHMHKDRDRQRREHGEVSLAALSVQGVDRSHQPLALAAKVGQELHSAVGVRPSAQRLTAVGYGPKKPRVSNKTPEGREQNRRVEFLILGETP